MRDARQSTRGKTLPLSEFESMLRRVLTKPRASHHEPNVQAGA
jgi:hypothetical protein